MSAISKMVTEVKTIKEYWTKEVRRQKVLEPNVPKVGEMAVNFTLTDSSGEHTVTLSDFQGKKPVALIFGSFT